jgi:hypothetical protein
MQQHLIRVEINILRQIILEWRWCSSKHVATVPVHETFEGRTVWQGEVEVFDLIGHFKANRCYAWAYQDDEGKTRYETVLELPPVQSAQDAVKAALAEQAKRDEIKARWAKFAKRQSARRKYKPTGRGRKPRT